MARCGGFRTGHFRSETIPAGSIGWRVWLKTLPNANLLRGAWRRSMGLSERWQSQPRWVKVLPIFCRRCAGGWDARRARFGKCEGRRGLEEVRRANRERGRGKLTGEFKLEETGRTEQKTKSCVALMYGVRRMAGLRTSVG